MWVLAPHWVKEESFVVSEMHLFEALGETPDSTVWVSEQLRIQCVTLSLLVCPLQV